MYARLYIHKGPLRTLRLQGLLKKAKYKYVRVLCFAILAINICV